MLGPIALSGCSIQDELLEPQQPGIITPGDIVSAGSTGAQALYVGALGALKNWTGGGGGSNQENIWLYADLLTDVWKVSDTFIQRIDTDARRVQPNNSTVSSAYSTMTQSRGFYRDAIRSLGELLPNEPEKQGEMYFALGYTEMFMGEIFCNGIPLGETLAGEVTYSKPYTNAEVFEIALTHLDSAIALTSGSVASTTLAQRVQYAARVAKGRTLINLGRYAEAAAAVSGIPTNAQYTLTYSQPTQSNAIWTMNSTPSVARYAVGDSAELVNEVEVVIKNALPFASAKDPRVPVSGSFKDKSRKSIDGLTNYVGQLIWKNRDDPLVLASGIDARLVEAEAALKSGGIPAMMTILNAMRASPQTLGHFAVPAMPALATPANDQAAIDLLFREKAFWQFARGTRLGDLRRLMRQYGRAEENVFPEGPFIKTYSTYGDDVNLPVTDNEKTNPNFSGCLDRSA